MGKSAQRRRNARADAKQARRERADASAVMPGAYEPPSPEDCEGFEYTYFFDEEAALKVWDRTYRIDGILRRFSIELYLVSLLDEESEIMRFCCSHGTHHVHTGDTKRNLSSIDDIHDLRSAYDQASILVNDAARNLIERRDANDSQ